MSESKGGYPIYEAIKLAVEAGEELKSFFRDLGIHDAHYIAGASYWAGELEAHPNLSIHLPEGKDFEAMKERASELVADLKNRDVRVTILPYDASYGR
jgi:hypothetical protein